MKYRLGACAAVLLLAACHDGSVDTGNQGAMSASHASPLSTLTAGRSMGGTSIANAPDHGALLEYGNGGKPMKREGAHTWYPVQVSEEHAIRAIVDGEMTIPYPDGTQAKLRYERHVEGPDGNWSWIGRVEGGDPGQEAIFTFGEKAVFGSIPQPNGQPPLQIKTSNGGLWAITSDPGKLRIPEADGDVKIPPSRPNMASKAIASVEAQQIAAGALAAATQTARNTIDVAIGYTSGFRAEQGSQSAAVTRLNFLIEVGNQTFRNSKVNGFLRLVKAVEISYSDATTNKSAVEQLTGSDGVNDVGIPAALKPLRSARDTYGADIAMLVRKFSTPENDGCGIAWLIGAEGEPIEPARDDDFGFAVVSDGTDTDVDGQTYYCPDETLVHEAAHLMGSAHERENSSTQGRYYYSYGYVSVFDGFHTVMAYGDPSQVLYRTFSNPNSTFCQGEKCGTIAEDNAQSLNNTIPVVSEFRAVRVPMQGNLVAQDFNADGKSDIFWRNISNGVNSIWLSANRATSRAVTPVSSLAWKVVGIGDFNGDAESDVFWRNTGSGSNSIWLSGNRATLQAVASENSLTAKVVAVGDFNGDGKSDLFWRNSSNGANSIWLSGNRSTLQAVATEVSRTWEVVGAGDFNGDGKSDVFWRNSNSGVNSIWLSGNRSTSKTVATEKSPAWKVVGVGDFDGDGKSDVFWRNSSSGVNSIWLSANRATSQMVPTERSQAWQVVDVGDYNGDGKSDLFWRNLSSGVNSLWLSANRATSQAVFREPSAAWRVVPE